MNVFLIMKSSEVNLALSINQYKVVDINIGTNMEIFSEIIVQNKVSEIMHIFRELCTSPFPGLVHFANFLNPMNSTTFVLFGKYCPIVDQLGLKDSSRDFQLNCVISYFFTYI